MADIETTAQQGAPQGEPALDPAISAQTTGTEQTPGETEQSPDVEAKIDEPGEAEKPKQPPWVQARIDELTRLRREAERERDAYRRMLDERRAGEEPAPPQQPVGDIDALAQMRAREIVAQQAFDAACNDAYAKGSEQFGEDEFSAAVTNLRLSGVVERRDFIEAALDTGDPARVLYALGKDPDRAAALLALSPTRMAIEMDRMARAAPPSKPISGAPPPVKPVTGTAKAEPNESEMSIDEWMAHRNKQVRGR